MSIATFAAPNRDQAVPPRTPDVRLRAIEPGDAEAAARITYEAFAGIHDRHRSRATSPRSTWPASS